MALLFTSQLNTQPKEVVMRTNTRILRIALVTVGIILALAVQVVFAKIPGVVPPDATAEESYGKTYGEWSAEWWTLVFSLPVEGHPLADETGAQCAVGQSESSPVFFLMGTTGGAVKRTCTIPAGKAILIPIINNACAVPDDGDTIDDIKAVSSGTIDLVDLRSLEVEVDGKKLKGLENFRFISPIFSFTGATPNIFSTSQQAWYEGSREFAFADGFWVLLDPLPVGEHDISFTGKIPKWGFKISIKYKLIVE